MENNVNKIIFALLVLLTIARQAPARMLSAPEIILPVPELQANQVAVIVNTQDPLSKRIGEYYQKVRNIPKENMISVSIPLEQSSLDPQKFTKIKEYVDSQLQSRIQAITLTWASPYRVGGMSITSAFTFGYDQAFTATGCNATKKSPLFNSNSTHPFDDLGLRPCMSIATNDFETAQKLIDRGKESDGSWPKNASAYLMVTSDEARSVRHHYWGRIINDFAEVLQVKRYYSDKLENRQDILFYFTGLVRVEGIDTNTYLPGAVADHLTSAGGMLTDSSQMSALRWIEAGATGSYGAVVEPCNFLEKFPNPYILMVKYLTGEPLILAYWKSVAMPGQGIFIGDPLASPFGGYKVKTGPSEIVVRTRALQPGRYTVVASASGFPPYRPVKAQLSAQPEEQTIIIQENTNSFYRILHEK